ncbi:Transmembrane protein 59 [Liparis tanakae]|uniref:Transmembrane protein 59 n=1 Tax=Liparis tanakae TaxID=230148 RepID=A0A4Z2JDN5_9TELE|nr:Transmembrane protein 59 [Liparis tanakae]
MGSRFLFVCTWGLCVLFAATSASGDVFDSVLGNTQSCHKSCEMTYSLHTYPREEELYACQRGCRLFSICQFVRDIDDLNQTKSECESSKLRPEPSTCLLCARYRCDPVLTFVISLHLHTSAACREAYSHSDEQYACNLGCQNQLPFAEHRLEQLEAMMPRIHLLHPLTLVRGLWEDVMSQAHSFITSTWTFYLQADDGKVVIFQNNVNNMALSFVYKTEPQVRFFSQFEVEKDVAEEPQKSFPGLSPVYKEYHRTLIQERDRDMTGDRSYADEYNLFNCLSRNPWLPGWILTTTLILSVLVLIWICCATVATAVDQYVPAEKLSIYGDRENVKDQKLTPYPASSLLIITSKGSEEEAGPLPSKVNLSQSDI